MSRRYITETSARLLPSGRPSFELSVGWNTTTPLVDGSFYLILESNVDDDPPWTRGLAGDMPTFGDLMVELEEMGRDGVISWPVDPVLLDVLRDDQARNLSSNDQDWNEVERRKGLFV